MDNKISSKDSKNSQFNRNNEFMDSQDKEIDQSKRNNLENTQHGTYEDFRE